jgi:hypothetical protein
MAPRSPLVAAGLAAGALVTGFGIAGCLVAAPPPPPQQPGAAAEPPVYVAAEPPGERPPMAQPVLHPGDYACQIEDYPAFRCVVYAAEDGALRLEKLEGSQRFRGRVFAAESGFDFEGTFFCPWGDCTQEVSAQFRPQGDGTFRGTMKTAGIQVVTLRHVPGGWTYGGLGYGGLGYGGLGYGGVQPFVD